MPLKSRSVPMIGNPHCGSVVSPPVPVLAGSGYAHLGVLHNKGHVTDAPDIDYPAEHLGADV